MFPLTTKQIRHVHKKEGLEDLVRKCLIEHEFTFKDVYPHVYSPLDVYGSYALKARTTLWSLGLLPSMSMVLSRELARAAAAAAPASTNTGPLPFPLRHLTGGRRECDSIAFIKFSSRSSPLWLGSLHAKFFFGIGDLSPPPPSR
jgi:hypothetical protein